MKLDEACFHPISLAVSFLLEPYARRCSSFLTCVLGSTWLFELPWVYPPSFYYIKVIFLQKKQQSIDISVITSKHSNDSIQKYCFNPRGKSPVVTTNLTKLSLKSFCRWWGLWVGIMSYSGQYYSKSKEASDPRYSVVVKQFMKKMLKVVHIFLLLWRIHLCIIISRGFTVTPRTKPALFFIFLSLYPGPDSATTTDDGRGDYTLYSRVIADMQDFVANLEEPKLHQKVESALFLLADSFTVETQVFVLYTPNLYSGV